MIQSTMWLTEMDKTHLNGDHQDIDPDDTASYFNGSVSSPNKLLTFVWHCKLDTTKWWLTSQEYNIDFTTVASKIVDNVCISSSLMFNPNVQYQAG